MLNILEASKHDTSFPNLEGNEVFFCFRFLIGRTVSWKPWPRMDYPTTVPQLLNIDQFGCRVCCLSLTIRWFWVWVSFLSSRPPTPTDIFNKCYSHRLCTGFFSLLIIISLSNYSPPVWQVLQVLDHFLSQVCL